MRRKGKKKKDEDPHSPAPKYKRKKRSPSGRRLREGSGIFERRKKRIYTNASREE